MCVIRICTYTYYKKMFPMISKENSNSPKSLEPPSSAKCLIRIMLPTKHKSAYKSVNIFMGVRINQNIKQPKIYIPFSASTALFENAFVYIIQNITLNSNYTIINT